MAITVIDVAKKANVSATTVSLCFQDESRVSESTRARVLKAAQDIGYVPNQFARRLRSGKSRLIGLLVAEVYTPFMAEIIAGVERTVIEKGYNVLVFSTFRDIEIEKRLVQAASELKVEGLIVTACEKDNPLLQQLSESSFPTVYLDSFPPKPTCPYVVNDMEAVSRVGTEYLLGIGHRRILLLNGEERSKSFSSFASMERAYKLALEKWRVPLDHQLIRYHGTDLQHGYEGTKNALGDGLDFSAIFAISDNVALGVIECLETHGKRVPQDVSVLGIDNSEISGLSRIGLSTIETYHRTSGKEDMGELAAKALLKIIEEGPDAQVEPVVLKPRLVLRKSCQEYELAA